VAGGLANQATDRLHHVSLHVKHGARQRQGSIRQRLLWRGRVGQADPHRRREPCSVGGEVRNARSQLAQDHHHLHSGKGARWQSLATRKEQ